MRRSPALICLLAVVCMVGLGVAGDADDFWGPGVWTDDFEDGDYTNNPTWTTFSTPVGASRAVVSWEGDYAFRLTAAYLAPAGAGWSGAYVNNSQDEQGMLVWVDSSPLASDDWAAICLLRYSPPTLGFGTGYAVAILHLASGAIAAQLFQINDTGYTDVTGAVQVSETYTDVWVRFVALGSDATTRLAARVWPVGDTEPTNGWTLDSSTTGGGSGITAYYNTGNGGVGVVATADAVTADAYFDDIQYLQAAGPLNAEPLPW